MAVTPPSVVLELLFTEAAKRKDGRPLDEDSSNIVVYIVDFDIDMRFRDTSTHQHIPYRSSDGS